MWSNARDIAAGDTVIIWLTRDVIQPLVISPGKELNGRFGCYRHADLVGKPYGSKIRSRNGRGFIHVLRPTPELWTLALPHRTQILYLADIAFITAMLGIKPGSKVIEAGTGSGSFSHSIARTIGPSGHLYTFEFHEVRANKARDEFDQHGMTSTVTLTHRNVCKDGFELEDAIDSVFLDLPAPWDAVEHAKKALVKNRTTRICCFSPCIEQVLRSVSALNDAGFSDITMYEALLRPHDVYSTPTLISIDEVAQRLKSLEHKAETRRLSQIAQAQVYNAKKRKRPEDEQNDITDDVTKKRKSDDIPPPEMVVSAAGVADMEVETNQGPLTTTIDESGGPVTFDSTNSYTVPFSVSKPLSEVRGHTSYLTFASLLPSTSPGSGSSSQSLLSESDKVLPQISQSL